MVFSSLKNSRLLLQSLVIGALVFAFTPARAQDQGDLENMRFSRVMVPVDTVTLKSEGVEIRLWGIQPASTSETQLELRALQVMQDMIKNGEVQCKIMNADNVIRPLARCNTKDNEDIGLTLLQKGLAVRDRRALYGSVFASSYQEAEETARQSASGIWAYVDMTDGNLIQQVLNDEEKLLIFMALMFGLPMLAVLLLGLSVRHNINRLLHFQTQEASSHFDKEQALYRREKNLVLSRIEAELEENKSRVEAFLTVYTEMLSNIKNPDATPQYQHAGDVVSLQPNFSHDVFDKNIEKLSSLDMKLSAELTKFYSYIGSDGEYVDLSPNTPREEAITIVDKVVSDAREFLPMLDRAIDMVRSNQMADDT